MAEAIDLQKVLEVYNSISPSRTRWIRNRYEMRNRWKELFKVLEEASGRDGGKVVLFDPNWHTVGQKGATTGAVNKKVEAKVEEPKDEEPAKDQEVKKPKKSAKK